MKMIPTKKSEALPVLRQDLNDVFDRFFREWDDGLLAGWPATARGSFLPLLDVEETESEYAVSMDVPGMDAKNIQIQAFNDHLVVAGEQHSEAETKDKEYLRRERRFGSFKRVIPLPQNARVSRDDVAAHYKNGVLKIRIPKAAPTPNLRIPIREE